jgi:hypothetical protein
MFLLRNDSSRSRPDMTSHLRQVATTGPGETTSVCSSHQKFFSALLKIMRLKRKVYENIHIFCGLTLMLLAKAAGVKRLHGTLLTLDVRWTGD